MSKFALLTLDNSCLIKYKIKQNKNTTENNFPGVRERFSFILNVHYVGHIELLSDKMIFLFDKRVASMVIVKISAASIIFFCLGVKT